MLLDTGSRCASPLSIDGVAFGVGTRSTSRVLTVQVGQTVLDRYMDDLEADEVHASNAFVRAIQLLKANVHPVTVGVVYDAVGLFS